jgi:hypothetical protein
VKPFRFHRKADAEFSDAAGYYANINPELGRRFCEAIHEIISEICAAPARYRTILAPVRRHFHAHFPYAVLYIDRPDGVWIVSVSAFKRDPNHWRERLD